MVDSVFFFAPANWCLPAGKKNIMSFDKARENDDGR